MVVNTARGAVINIPDLLAALDSGQLDSAGLDVLPDEPARPGERLTEHPRVVLTRIRRFIPWRARSAPNQGGAQFDHLRRGRDAPTTRS